MHHVDRSFERIREFVSEKKLSPTSLARQAKLGANTLRDLFSPRWNPRADTLRKIEQYLSEREDAA